MIELLTLCGYEPDEIESELPRMQKTFTKFGLTDKDIGQGKERLTKYYDVELKGVRKLFGLFLKELVNLTLAKEEGKKKIINGCMAPAFDVLGSALVSHSHEVLAAVPNPAIQIILGCVFDRFVPILEAAERQWLKGGVVGHCANVKTRLGLHALNLIPKPDLLVTSGPLCETSPKTNDLLEELYGIPTFCYDTCQDRDLREYPDSARTIAFVGKGMRGLAHRLEEVTGVEITDDMLWEVLRAKGRLMAALGKVRNVIRHSDPLVLSPKHDTLLVYVNTFPYSIDAISGPINAINTLYEELQARVEQGMGVVEKGAPRILAILPHQHGDPRLEHLVDEMGMAMVATDAEFSAPPGGKTPTDPYEAMSVYLQSSLYYHLGGRVSIILEACKQLKIDGVLDHFHVGCRGVAADALIIRDAVKKELGIPVLLLEWENFDPRVYDHRQYKARLEVFKSMLRTNR